MHINSLAREYSFLFLYHLTFCQERDELLPLIQELLIYERNQNIKYSSSAYKKGYKSAPPPPPSTSELESDSLLKFPEGKNWTYFQKVIQDRLISFNSALEVEKIPPQGPSLEFAEDLILGVLKNLKVIRELIIQFSGKWSPEKMNRVDLTLLILSTYEMVIYKKTPPKVVIDEAINLAKKYSDKTSYAFINGILDSISKSESVNS